MILIGGCAGFFVVPMNALLQHRGHVLMGAGHSIAVQNFNENIGILVMVGVYALMVRAGIGINVAIVMFGVFVSGAMVLVMIRHRANQARGDSLHLIGIDRAGAGAPVGRLEQDRTVGKLVRSGSAGAGEMLREQAR